MKLSTPRLFHRSVMMPFNSLQQAARNKCLKDDSHSLPVQDLGPFAQENDCQPLLRSTTFCSFCSKTAGTMHAHGLRMAWCRRQHTAALLPAHMHAAALRPQSHTPRIGRRLTDTKPVHGKKCSHVLLQRHESVASVSTTHTQSESSVCVCIF